MIRTGSYPFYRLKAYVVTLAMVFEVLLMAGAGFQCDAQVVVSIGQNFTASLSSDSNFDPPDSNGAVGPAHFVELINGQFAVFDKGTGTRLKTMTDLTFWSQAGITMPSEWLTSDPRIIYDPTVQRWFASQADFDPSGTINTNCFLLAISASAEDR